MTVDSLLSAADVNRQDSEASCFHIGVSDDLGSSFSTNIREEDGAATTDTGSLSDDAFHTRVLDADAAGDDIAATLSSFDANGFTLAYTTNPGTARHFGALAISVPPVGGVTPINQSLHHIEQGIAGAQSQGRHSIESGIPA